MSKADDALRTIGEVSKILNIPIPVIQKCGGGSVRCMIAELI